jgi:integrase
MKIDLKGARLVKRRLADGTIKTYHYLGRGKGAPRLKGEPGSAEFLASYQGAAAKRKRDRERVTDTLIDDYFDSGHFTQRLAERTRADYQKLGRAFRAKFGKVPIAFWRDPRSRKKLRKFRDALAVASPRQADYMWSFMSTVFSLAVDDGELAVNPCARGGRLYDGTRVDKIWSPEQIDAMLGIEGYTHLRLPLMIALWTGLHQGDILKLDWSEYDGAFLRVNQRKGRRHGHKPKILEVPIAPELKAVLDPERLDIGPICRSSEGKPWTANGFRSSWQKAAKAANVHRQVTFNDFRGTAVTRLYSSGVPKKDIGIFTGHRDAEINDILERHYLHREQRTEGIAAIEKLQAKFGGVRSGQNSPSNRG